MKRKEEIRPAMKIKIEVEVEVDSSPTRSWQDAKMPSYLYDLLRGKGSFAACC